MFCTKCGNELKNGDLFCTNCGNLLEKTDNNILDVDSTVSSDEKFDFDKQDGFDYSFDDDSEPVEDDSDFDTVGDVGNNETDFEETVYNELNFKENAQKENEDQYSQSEGYESGVNEYSQYSEENQGYAESYNEESSEPSVNYNYSEADQGYTESYGEENQGYTEDYNYNEGNQGYSENYNYSEGDQGYAKNYNEESSEYAAGYNYGEAGQGYTESYSEGNQGYTENYNYNNGDYSQEYNDYNQNGYETNYEQGYESSYNQNVEYYSNTEQYDQGNDQYGATYQDTTSATSALGNKKYVSLNNIPSQESGVAGEAGDASVIADSPALRKSNQKVAIIVASVIAGIVLLIGILVAVLIFTGIGKDFVEMVFGEPDVAVVQEIEEFDEEFEEETASEPEEQNTEEIVEEDTENEDSQNTEEVQEETAPEISFGSYPIDVELPVYVKLVETSDSQIQLINDNSGYTMTLNIYPDNTSLSNEHCNELVKNMIPISEHGSVAILIYDEDDTYKDLNSFVQPFLAQYYPQESDTYSLLSMINREDGTFDFGVYVGGEFKNIISSQDDYARFEQDMVKYGSHSKGFLYAFQDWLYQSGYELHGYDTDHALYQIIVTQGPLKMRDDASSLGEIVNLLPAGETLSVYSEKDGWLLVSYDSDSGWIKSDYCEKL